METAAARKQRLNALKAQAGSAPVEADSQAAAEPQLKFRNYQPTSKKIDHKIVEPAAPPVYQEPVAAPEQTSGNGQVGAYRGRLSPYDGLLQIKRGKSLQSCQVCSADRLKVQQHVHASVKLGLGQQLFSRYNVHLL